MSVQGKVAALYELGRKLILLRDPQRIADAALDIAAHVLNLPDSDFWLVDTARRELYVAARRGPAQEAECVRLPLDSGQGVTVAAARTRCPVCVPDVRQDTRYVHAGFPTISELAVPVQIEGQVLGVLNVVSGEPNAFGPEEEELLCILADQSALALENARLHAEERRQAEQMVVVNELSRRMSASLDLQATLDAIVAAAAGLLPCALAEVSLWDEQTQTLTLQALRCEPDRAFPLGQSFPPGEGYTGWVVRHKKPLLVPDVEARQDIRPHLLPGELPFAAYAGVPLLVDQELIGTLVVVANEAGALSDRDLELLVTLAAQAAAAIRNARLFEEVTRHQRELAALYAIAEAANRPLNLHDLLQYALERVVEVTHADGGAIRLLDPESGELALAAQSGLSEAYARQAGRFPLAEEMVGRVASMAEPVLSKDMLADPRVSSQVGELLREVGHRSLVMAPLLAQEHVLGTLGVVSKAPGFFGQDDARLVSAIGQQLGTAITNARLRQERLDAERLAAVGRVAASVAHDLRSPLGGILRSAELLARTELSPGTRQKLSGAIVSLALRAEYLTLWGASLGVGPGVRPRYEN